MRHAVWRCGTGFPAIRSFEYDYMIVPFRLYCICFPAKSFPDCEIRKVKLL